MSHDSDIAYEKASHYFNSWIPCLGLLHAEITGKFCLTVWPWLSWNSQRTSCLCFANAEIKRLVPPCLARENTNGKRCIPYPCPHSETILTSVSKNMHTWLEHSSLGLGVVARAFNLSAGGSLWVSGQSGLQVVLGQPRLHSELQSSRKQGKEGREEGRKAGRGKGRIVAWSYTVFCRSPLLSSNFKISRDFSR